MNNDKSEVTIPSPPVTPPAAEIPPSNDGEVMSALFILCTGIGKELDRLCVRMNCDPVTEMDQVERALSTDSVVLGDLLDKVPRIRCSASTFARVAVGLSQAAVSKSAGAGVSRHGLEQAMPLSATLLAWRDLDACGSLFVPVKH